MLDPENETSPSEQDGAGPVEEQAPAAKTTRAPRKTTSRSSAAKRAAGPADSPADSPEAHSPEAPPAGDGEESAPPAKKTAARRPRKSAAAAPASPAPASGESGDAEAPSAADAPGAPAGQAPLFQAPAVSTTVRKRATRKTAPPAETPAAGSTDAASEDTDSDSAATGSSAGSAPAKKAAKRPAKKAAAQTQDGATEAGAQDAEGDAGPAGSQDEPKPAKKKAGKKKSAADADAAETEQGEDKPKKKSGKKKSGKKKSSDEGEKADETPESTETDETAESAAPGSTGADGETSGDGEAGNSDDSDETDGDDNGEGSGGRRRPRRRGGRRRRRGGGGGESADNGEAGESGSAQDADTSGDDTGSDDDSSDDDGEQGSGSRRRRRRRRGGGGNSGGDNGGERRARNPEDEITSLSGSTRLEAKKQRRREGREAGRRRAPIVSEAEFLARRESVERTMVVRQRDDLTQIGVLEDKVLVEHYVSRESQTSMIGNVYLGRVQNVLPSMEAAFIDIGKGRNAVLYAGEVNWKALGAKDGQPRTVESVLSPGQPVLVQVSKDPIGHKGARLTSQISLPGRFLVYVPDGTTSGISRKLPEGERSRLKTLLKEIVPDSAGVIVRTAAEGASEEELTRDVERLTARWDDIDEKVKAGGGKGGAPQLLYGEPDLTLKVVRDLFTEDFSRLVVQGQDAWELVDGYVSHVAPELRERLEHYVPGDHDDVDLFAAHRVDEQIAKGLDRKVWLPSGGSLVIDRTEAMTVVDVNTGKFTGSGGNLEETVTKNNLEAAEEVVRQLRLRDIGGIVVVDFIDMVMESNRDLVLRRLVECLGRDRTRHQVAEVTSLGLVQMTRKRIGTGLLEAFSDDCPHCKGRGLVVHDHPVEPSTRREDDSRRGGGRRGRGNGGGSNGGGSNGGGGSHGGNGGSNGSRQGSGGSNGQAAGGSSHPPSPADVAAIARPENADKPPLDEQPASAAQADEQPASAQSTSEEQVGSGATPDAPTPDASVGSSEPSDTQTESRSDEQPTPVDPAPARVTSRRRTARRAAGPPADAPSAPEAPEPEAESAVSLDPTPADAPVVEDETLPLDAAATGADESGEGAEDESEDSVLAVPVKRRGGRRR